ncbi:C-CAP/cofactor C-like domain-containing protein [Actinidia rufa]|uniref:C-CAP/cofactor C-like domain-containing protein n=1 Tax=Actinidia rufa TaxID=165716 RepID=A0A7J0E278_9ERIC|nr:C-CAP/cofactor C-like domain-containing protein [Actinidia rufa]
MEEEPEDLPNPNQTSEKTLTPPLASTPPCSSASPTENNLSLLASLPLGLQHRSFESTHSFLSRFSQSKLSIDSDLARSVSKSDLDRVSISISISDLEKLVAENSYFLPSYEVRTCLKTLSDLKQTVENVTSEIVPKKKFGFKNKKASTGVGCLRALFVHRLRNCKVYVGSVFGSVLIEDVEGCVFVLASHQIRVHHARWNDLYLRARSRPIIEDGNAVRFAPYCLSYDGIEGDLREANLDEETGKWANVG